MFLEVVKTIYMFVGDVVAATNNTLSICHTKNFTVRANTAYTVVCQNFCSHFQKLVLKSNPEFKWLSENVKTMYMFVGDVVAATIYT